MITTPAVSGEPGQAPYAYNPLTKTPLIDLGPEGIVSPQTALILPSIAPNGLFYLGVDTWGLPCSSWE